MDGNLLTYVFIYFRQLVCQYKLFVSEVKSYRMTEPLFLACRGFAENVVLTVKNCFYEEEMRKILIEKCGEQITYHDRLCSGLVPFEGAKTRLVSIQCNTWFNSLEQLYFPQINTNDTDELDIFENEFEDKCISIVKERNLKNEEKDVKVETHDENVLSNDKDSDDDFVQTTKKSKPEKFECDVCGLRFKTKKSLGIHKGKRHKTNEEEETPPCTCLIEGCENYGRKFANTIQYKKHMRIVHQLPKRGRKPKQETQCEDENSEGPKSCDICGKIFYSKLNLLKHIKRSHGTKQKPCHICGMMVKELSIHVKYQVTDLLT